MTKEKLPVVYKPRNIQEMFANNPPKEGLYYITGLWNIPWIIKLPKGFRFHSRDKIKVKIASKPRSLLALAYQMGVEDGENGKIKAIKNIGKPECSIQLLTVSKKWYKEHYDEELPKQLKGNPKL